MMTLRSRCIRDISKGLLHICSGHCSRSSRRSVYTLCSHLNDLPRESLNDGKVDLRDCNYQRYSTSAKKGNKLRRDLNMLTYIGAVIDELEGPSHCWLNRAEDLKNKNIRKSRGFLVLSGDFMGISSQSSSGLVLMIERAKLLLQRHPWLQVVGFQYSESISSRSTRAHLFQSIMSEYITFPVILSNKTFTEMKSGSYTLFKDFGGPLIYHKKDVNFSVLDKAVRDLDLQHGEEPSLADKLKGSWVTPVDIAKEPHLLLQNLLFCFPGCISVDSGGNRLFLSDSNHHRIIVTDINGQILDSIGSCPGFDDGDFECAKLLRPASSFYHDAERCLYFVDSENDSSFTLSTIKHSMSNHLAGMHILTLLSLFSFYLTNFLCLQSLKNHAIRKADMEKRVVQTIYPTTVLPDVENEKDSSLWAWVLDKLGVKREVPPQSKENTSESFLFPWHLIKSSQNHLCVLNRSFQTLWIVDLDSGSIREIVKGAEKILENCGPMLLEKSRLLGQFPRDWLERQEYDDFSLEGVPHAGLLSSFAALGDHLFVCDTVAQMVLKLDSKSKMISRLPLSNFGNLGLPYWFTSSLEKVYSLGALSRRHIDHTQCFHLLPGRVDIKLNIDIPQDTDLVEPLQECSVWRQARGAAIEVSGAKNKAESTEKTGVAQQWYDELDNLAYLVEPETDLSTVEESSAPKAEVPETKICIDCSICTSPGESEVVINAVLYLKLKIDPSSVADDQEKKLARLAELLNPIQSVSRDSLVHLLSKSNKSAEEFIFMRPLHVRLKFKCDLHPKGESTKNVLLTTSSVGVDVFLR
ncbi:ubiquitin-protein ligase [Lithospermum erythrorhizon]|uniref:Ubiquitin-protein ligase n=1 Tax=Lithospermum erythrorhizon TaxID=34254 RepID=A0AAV3NWK1_LITER